MTIDIKALILPAAIGLISAASPEAGQLITDARDAAADKKLTADEAKKIFFDGIDLAVKVWPQGAPALLSLKMNIEVDLPNIEKTIVAFENLIAPSA
jgi:hypothetical protein